MKQVSGEDYDTPITELLANKSVLQAKSRQERKRPKGTRVTGKSGVIEAEECGPNNACSNEESCGEEKRPQ